MMKNGDHEGQTFLSHPHTNNEFFFLLTIKKPIFIFKKRIPEVPKFAEMCHNIMMSLKQNNYVMCL